jgi:hypothetical protein
MIEHMVLDAEHNLVPADLMTWAMFFEDSDARRVAETTVGEARVSTVFLGIDHEFGGAPLWFETMVFGGQHDEYTDRYTTWEEAVAGHGRIVSALIEGREP